MITDTIDGALLRDMFLAGAALLEKNRALVDSLNVFPVPDGDTGTNMSMTMQGAVKDLRNLPETATVEEVMAKVSSGALRSARGNSGVILSQLFRGFYKAAKGHEELDGISFAAAMAEGTKAAYKAVMKPKEGTILTVSRMISDEVQKAVEEDAQLGCEALMITCIQKGEEALRLTPDLLPVLKEAGVVDSGGKGLLFIYHGFLMAMNGEMDIEELPAEEKPAEKETSEAANFAEFSAEDIQFGYCTEFFIVHLYEGFEEKDLDQFRKHLERVGDSVVCACDNDTVKIHVHSNCPGKVLQMAMRYGELDRIKIENMREQNRQLAAQRKRNEKEFALISVSCGAGVDEVFKALGFGPLQLPRGGAAHQDHPPGHRRGHGLQSGRVLGDQREQHDRGLPGGRLRLRDLRGPGDPAQWQGHPPGGLHRHAGRGFEHGEPGCGRSRLRAGGAHDREAGGRGMLRHRVLRRGRGRGAGRRPHRPVGGEVPRVRVHEPQRGTAPLQLLFLGDLRKDFPSRPSAAFFKPWSLRTSRASGQSA